MGERAARTRTWKPTRSKAKFVFFGDDDGDDDDELRTKARGVLSKPTTKARLKFRVARVE
jgi:hypothetical protein